MSYWKHCWSFRYTLTETMRLQDVILKHASILFLDTKINIFEEACNFSFVQLLCSNVLLHSVLLVVVFGELFSPKILVDYVSSAGSNAKKHLRGEFGALRINLTWLGCPVCLQFLGVKEAWSTIHPYYCFICRTVTFCHSYLFLTAFHSLTTLTERSNYFFL